MELKIEYIPVEDLKPYERNNKKHADFDVGEIAKSIEKYGFNDPIGIYGKNIIVEGHGRLLAAKKLGMETVPCIRLDHMTDKERREYAILHNKTAELAEYDFANIELELPDLDFSEFDIDFGFPINDEETEIIEDEVPEVDEEHEPTVKLGDIWQLGRHRLMCGDSTDKATVEKMMNGEIASLALTDPPYGINVVSHKTESGNSIVGNGLEKTCFRDEHGTVIGKGIGKFKPKVYDKIINDNTTETSKASFGILTEFSENQIIFGGNYFCDFLPPKACWIVWDKENGDSFLADGELAWTSFDKGVKIYKWLWNGMSRKGDRKTELKERVHPTQKPVGLMSEILKDFTSQDEMVIDLFGGSGSTLIACEQLNRICYMCELSEKYCDVIIKRWENLTGEKAVKINE